MSTKFKITIKCALFSILLALAGCRQGSASSTLLGMFTPPPAAERDESLNLLLDGKEDQFKSRFIGKCAQEIMQVFGNYGSGLKYKIDYKGHVIHLEFSLNLLGLCREVYIVVHKNYHDQTANYQGPGGWHGHPMVVVTQNQSSNPPVIVSHAQQK